MGGGGVPVNPLMGQSLELSKCWSYRSNPSLTDKNPLSIDYPVGCSKKYKYLKIIVEHPMNLSFGQVEQDKTKKIKIGAYLVYWNWKNILQVILSKNTKEMSVFQFFTFNSKCCSCEII